MGWKCACIFVGEVDNQYFSTRPQHLPEKARAIRKALGQDSCSNAESHHMNIYPDAGKLVIGAFENGAFIADQDIIDQLEKGDDSYCKQALSFFPGGGLLALGLHSVVNYSAFAYYKNGQLVRSFACAADPGMIREEGEMLPEEIKQHEGSFERDGTRLFPRKFDERTVEFTIDSIGDDLVFDLSARPLGLRFDRLDTEDIFDTEIFYDNVKPQTPYRPPGKEQPKPKPFWKFW